ncbi:MAG: cupredoxin domain-containing protein [Myxococcota bacterium]
MSRSTLLSRLIASTLLALPLASGAHSEHEDEAHGASEAGHAGEHDGHASAPSQPASLAGAWSALMAARDGIATDLESGALGQVHAKAEPLPELVATLVGKSGDLEAGRRARVEGAARQVKRIADALHNAADGGDAARTRKALSRLDGLLQLIRAQYPAGALDAKPDGHEGHSAVSGYASGMRAHMERPAGMVKAAPRATLRVRAFDRLRFEPNRIEVRAGVPTRIVLENEGASEHSLVVKTPDGSRDWVHLHVLPGATKAATFQLDQPGTYPVACAIPGHAEGGMIGTLVVLPGRAQARATLRSPSPALPARPSSGVGR